MLDSEGKAVPGRDGSLWGVESLGDYALDEVAPELAGEILAELARDQARETRETRERVYWASRDVETVGV